MPALKYEIDWFHYCMMFLKSNIYCLTHSRYLQGIHFDYGAVTVDPKSVSYDPSPLKQYLASLNVPYFYEEQGMV